LADRALTHAALGSPPDRVYKEIKLMLNSKFGQWLSCIPMSQPRHTRRREVRRRLAALDRPADVLENRALLTAVATPYLVFSTQPGNIVAGHDLNFKVEVMINAKTNKGTVFTEVDTAFNGECSFTPVLGGTLGTFDTPYNFTGPQGPNAPFASVTLPVVDGVCGDHHDQTSIDVAGNYLIEAAVTEFSPGTGLFVINSNTFTVTPFSATDRLVFLKAPSEVTVDTPFSATVAVEDQYGNIDTGVNNVPVTLLALPGNSSKAEIKNGEATFNDAFFVASGEDPLVAIATPPTGAPLIGSAAVLVLNSNGGLGGSS
jgi:hypothetical protein